MLETVKVQEMNGRVTMQKEDFENLLADMESLIETVEIMSDKEMMANIKKGEEDIKAGRVKAIKTDKELKALLGI